MPPDVTWALTTQALPGGVTWSLAKRAEAAREVLRRDGTVDPFLVLSSFSCL